MKVCQYCGSPVPRETYLCPHCGAHEFDNRCPRCGTLYTASACPQCGLAADAEQHKCPNCGTRFFDDACPTCGYIPYVTRSRWAQAEGSAGTMTDGVSPKSRAVTLILSFALGIYGAHRFYAGKIGSGILYLCTVGLFGIGWLVDLIMILAGQFKDRDGLPITRW